MKKFLIIIFTLLSAISFGQNSFIRSSSGAFLMSGNSFLTTEATAPVDPPDPPTEGQIIADHNAVAAFDNIPDNWLDSVMTMNLGYVGESHSKGIGLGLAALESSDATYQVTTTDQPGVSTDSYLRNTEKFYYNSSWSDLGEAEWYGDATNIERIKTGLTYVSETYNGGRPYDVFGLGWCWDPAEVSSDMVDYISATIEYIEYCQTNNYPTVVIFTTGPVDGENASGETGWNKYLAYEVIRDSVANDPTRVLFDFADILCYDDGETTPNTTSWDGNTYPIITTTNLGDTYYAHMGTKAIERLAKAMWWMLARMAGWDGTTE